jgi:ABC-2 type transport system permease protein
MSQMELEVQKLWKQRFDRYAKETIGYWQYAARSNFIGFMLFLVIISSYYYAKTLQQLPTDYPYLWIVQLVLAPLLVWSPIRTLIREPDRMFLLRAELRMGGYFRKAFQYSLGIQSFTIFLAFIALLPLYRHCEGMAAQPFLLLLLFLLIVKATHLLASWHESRFADRRLRIATTMFRWAATILILWLLFAREVWLSGAVILTAVLIWYLVTRNASVYMVGWDCLIEKEKHQQAKLYAFFNWFIDVPQLPSRIRRRGWIANVTRWFAYNQANTYLYLYTKTLLRTELFGIVMRITLIGAIAILFIGSYAASAVTLLVVTLISTVQLSALGQAHRYTFWLETYPLDENRKAGSITWIIWATLFLQTCILAVALLIQAPAAYAIVPIIDLGLCSFVCGIILRRKFQAAT